MNGLRKCDIEYLLSTEDFTNLIVTHLGSLYLIEIKKIDMLNSLVEIMMILLKR